MSSEVAVALISSGAALGGTALGIWGTAWLERRRDRRQARSLWSAVSSDLYRWGTMFLEGGSGSLVLNPDNRLRWHEIAGDVAIHFPPRLSYLLEFVYANRDRAEHALRQFESRDITSKLELVAMQVEFRRWAMMAATTVDVGNRHFRRTRLQKLLRRHRLDESDDERNWGHVAHMMRVISASLREEGFDVDDSGAFRPMSELAAKRAQMFDAIRRQTRSNESPLKE